MEDQKNEKKQKTFGWAGTLFSANVSAVRVLGLEISRFADEHDKAAFTDFAKEASKILSIPLTDHPDDQTSSGAEKANDPIELSVESGHRLTLKIESPEELEALAGILKSFFRRQPVQGKLLRNGALITLVSFFEGLVSDILHVFYTKHPKALPADSRSLSLSDLRAVGSILGAEQLLVSKEIDSLLRESLDDQLEYFSKRLKVDISPLDPFRNELSEVSQRRNLLVHNLGAVNRYYLEQVAPELRERYSATEGDELYTSVDYFKTAIDVVQASGMLLLQQCWRKWGSKGDGPDGFLIDHLYDSLVERNFDLMVRLSEYVLRIPFAKDDVRRRAIINVAIAFKELEKPEDVKRILECCDWSACALVFKVALAALHGEHDRLFELLPKAVAAGEIQESNLRDWPLFAPYRQEERFIEKVEKLFPKAASENQDTG